MARNYDFNELELAGKIEERVGKLRDQIRENMARAGLNASGRTSKSMTIYRETLKDSIRVTLVGRPFFGSLETGSSQWRGRYMKFSIKDFVPIIAEWIRDKGLKVDNVDKAATSIAWSIARRGTRARRERLYRTDIYTEPVKQAQEELKELVTLFWRTKIKETILKYREAAIK